MELSDRPTAIFAMNDLMAGGVIDAANEKGLKVPDDLSIIGFDNREFSFFYTPKLTTIKLPLNEMGKAAAEALIGMMDKKTDVRERLIKCRCELVELDSVKVV